MLFVGEIVEDISKKPQIKKINSLHLCFDEISSSRLFLNQSSFYYIGSKVKNETQTVFQLRLRDVSVRRIQKKNDNIQNLNKKIIFHQTLKVIVKDIGKGEKKRKHHFQSSIENPTKKKSSTQHVLLGDKLEDTAKTFREVH